MTATRTRLLRLPGRSSRRLRRLSGLSGRPDSRAGAFTSLLSLFDHHPHRVIAAAASSVAVVSGFAAGPVAAILAAVYTAMPLVVVSGRRRTRVRDRASAGALDLITVVASDLRAGADPAAVLAGALPAIRASGTVGVVLAGRVNAAVAVAEITGARLADLLDRLEVDARGQARARGVAIAQAAGAEATAWLLAALPIAGIALGYGIGADPLRVLLHTRIGAVCALAATVLQIAGLVWSRRLVRTILDAA